MWREERNQGVPSALPLRERQHPLLNVFANSYKLRSFEMDSKNTVPPFKEVKKKKNHMTNLIKQMGRFKFSSDE